MHLCSNPGVTEKTKRQVNQIFGYQYQKPVKPRFKKQTNVSAAQKEKAVKDGKILKNIKQQKLMETGKEESAALDFVPNLQEQNEETSENLENRLIIHRICGFKDVCAGQNLD